MDANDAVQTLRAAQGHPADWSFRSWQQPTIIAAVNNLAEALVLTATRRERADPSLTLRYFSGHQHRMGAAQNNNVRSG
eukprot:7209523-Heterocapsa_arctica.AAC.1